VPVSNVAYATVKVGLLVALASVMPDYGVFASWTLGLVVLVPMAALIFTRLIPAHVRATSNRTERLEPMQVLRYMPGDYLGAMAWLAATTLLPILVTHHAGLAQTAYFYLAWAIAFALHDVGDNMGYSLVVEGANDPTSLRASSRHVLIHTTRIVLVLAIIIVVAAPYLLMVFGPTYAAEATTLLQLLALAAIPNTINALYISIARVQRRTGAVVAVLGSLCIMVLGLSTVLLDWYGITGVGIAWLFSQTAIAGVLLVTRLRPYLLSRSASSERAAA
jgi:O-antigen/teichoic acid export membrane protein